MIGLPNKGVLATKGILAALVGILVAGLLVGSGCSKKGDGAKAKKVDCNQLCDKTFGTCVSEVLLASGKMGQKKLALFKKLGLLERVRKQGHDECLKGCRAKDGQFSDGKAATACLELADCKKFATCITRHIK